MDKYVLVYDNGEEYEDRETRFLCYFDATELDKANKFLEENQCQKVLLDIWIEKENNLEVKYKSLEQESAPIRPLPPNGQMSIRQNAEYTILVEDWKEKRAEYNRRYWERRKQINEKITQEIGPMPIYYNNLTIEKLPHLATIVAMLHN